MSMYSALPDLTEEQCADLASAVDHNFRHDRELVVTWNNRVMARALKTINTLRAQLAAAEAELSECRGQPHSSRASQLPHAAQIEHMNVACSKAHVIFRCDCGFAMGGPFRQDDWPCHRCGVGKLVAEPLRQRDQLLDACEIALAHVSELRGAWMRGAISECDGSGGTRSNRNVDVETQLRAAIAAAKGEA